jgi:hypothetical protein
LESPGCTAGALLSGKSHSVGWGCWNAGQIYAKRRSTVNIPWSLWGRHVAWHSLPYGVENPVGHWSCAIQ